MDDVMAPVLAGLREGDPAALLHTARAARFRMCHPFGDLEGAEAFDQSCLAPLRAALPDLERVDVIRITGIDQEGSRWLGCCGSYWGTFAAPFLGIPPTGQVVHMRYHDFYRIEGDRITEVQAIWDLPEVMMQAGVWPMGPQLGRFMGTPAPQTQDGLGPHDAALSHASQSHVIDMLTTMVRHPREGGPEVMELERYWHSKLMWYGPAGIGTARGVDGFRHHHQIPFLRAMPDRGLHPEGLKHHFFAEGAYVGVTGWPNMGQTLTGDGWLGLPPTGQKITLRSLDFWRIEAGLIRENWVLVDLLDVYHQLGVDVFARMKEVAWTKGYR
jgi:predicted ester cyclase